MFERVVIAMFFAGSKVSFSFSWLEIRLVFHVGSLSIRLCLLLLTKIFAKMMSFRLGKIATGGRQGCSGSVL